MPQLLQMGQLLPNAEQHVKETEQQTLPALPAVTAQHGALQLPFEHGQTMLRVMLVLMVSRYHRGMCGRGARRIRGRGGQRCR